MIVTGILISLLLHAIIPWPENDHPRVYDFLISIIITILVWEGNLRIDDMLNKKLPWVINPAKRILVHLPVSLVFSAFAIYIPMLVFNTYVCENVELHQGKLMLSSIAIGVLISFMILSVEISTQFFSNWKKSLVEVEKYKAESAQAQLQNLKSQINPHFLFNNMSVLASLVYKDQDKAVDFINQLSKVYRYLLDSRNSELVSLDSELAFIKSYTYLLQIRFDKSFVFEMDVPQNLLSKLIPPMALQMLVENAVKHNEVSTDHPLTVSVSANENYLTIKNNLQLRSNEEDATKTGLQNIRARYKHFTNNEVEIIENEKSYIVKIPLLENK
ncbi:MAG TPA: histidine kinase [Bacteroidia bacterium]|nr:histidine kinase [Bacteroidia bacterium]